MSTYLYVVRLVRPELFEHMHPEQEKAVEAHFERLKQDVQQGRIILAGPCTDGAFGIVIFEAQSEQEAETYVLSDPAVVAGIMSAELHPFRISLVRNQRVS